MVRRFGSVPSDESVPDVFGSGGSGAPTTSKYVVTEADAGLSAEVVRPQLGNFSADTYPASPDAMDDEFDDSTNMSGAVNGLNARWTWRNQGTATATYTKQGHITITPPASATPNIRIIEQAEPAGDYTVETKVSLEGAKINWAAAGLAAIDGVNGDIYTFSLRYGTTGDFEVTAQKFTSVTTFNSDPFGPERWGGSHAYIRMKYINATTTFEFWVSSDGLGWIRIGTFVDAVVANKVGLFINDESNTGLTKAHFDYFRRIA